MMKTLLPVLSLFSFLVCSCTSNNDSVAAFDYFEYQGQDSRFYKTIHHDYEYLNPIIAGFYPDPSICRKGEDYYMVHSTFSYFPGIPILRSKDLVNWQQVGNVLNRPSQLNLDNIRLSGGIYAPAISYNKYNDTFYLVTTCVDGIGNFVVKAKDPTKDWSDPIVLPKVGGIDPSLFFDDDGKAYLVHNDAPEGTPEYDGHRAIWMHEYDVNTDQTVGDPQVLIDGGVDKRTQPIWIEGPHIYKINGKYYLMAAEGGTSSQHSEVIFIADRVQGPYKPMKINPILTQRDLPEERTEKVTSVGHADLIETPDGKWFAVFLGCRPYKEDMYNTGRETFLLPVNWIKETPVILEKGVELPTMVTSKNWKENTTGISPEPFSGNFTWRDNFEDEKLSLRWLFIRTPQKHWWKLENNQLQITGTSVSINEIASPAFIGHRQQHTDFMVTTKMSFTPATDQNIAGLVCYQNEKNHLLFGKTRMNEQEKLIVIRTANGEASTSQEYILPENEVGKPIQLRVVGKGSLYSFQYASTPNAWKDIATNVDASILSTQKAGGFTGVVIGMYVCK